MKNLFHRSRSGQALLLVVVMMGGIFFLVTAVMGLLVYYQLEQSNEIAHSTEAIFAADAGLERAMRYFFHEYGPAHCNNTFPCVITTDTYVPRVSFANGASADARVEITDPAAGPVRISSDGNDPAVRTIRSFEVYFTLGG